MEIYLVGGAVRDFLLAKIHYPFKSQQDEQAYWAQVEKDWVVVGSTPEEMLKLGFRSVGKSFPVFLHPETQEEYALARTERKTGRGYTAFDCYFGTNVTLEEDLKRRDLTINAIAAKVDPNTFILEQIVDPYGGKNDLQQKLFRQVSSAFIEDPVRILRVARLASRFDDFIVHPELLMLMKQMVQEGEVDALVPERVWQEWQRSLNEKSPWQFLEILEQCGARERLFSEMGKLSLEKKQNLQQAVFNQELDTAKLGIELFGSEPTLLSKLLTKYRIPNDYAEIVLLVANYYPLYNEQITPELILTLFEKTDAFRRPERFQQFLAICSYFAASLSSKRNFLTEILYDLKNLNLKHLYNKNLAGQEIAKEVRQARLERIMQKSGD